MSLINNIATAKDRINTYGDRLAEGEHTLALGTFEEKSTAENGIIFAADFVVIESTGGHKPGDQVGVIWLVSAAESWKRDNEWARLRNFVAELTGKASAAEVAEQAGAMLAPHMPGRGLLVRATGKTSKPHIIKKGSNAGKMSEPFVNISWAHYAGQAPESIAKIRAYVDQRMPVPVASAPVQHAPSWGQQPPPGHPVNAPSYGMPAPVVPPPTPVWNGTAWVMPGAPPPSPAGQPHWSPPAPQAPPPPAWAPPPTPAPGPAPAPGGALLSHLLGK